MNAVSIDPTRRLALVGPGTKYSLLVSEAQKKGMMPDIEPAACLDFTFADWAHESLRMLSTTNSGVDGVLRNVKVIAPEQSFQTGFDSFPANGGGYDLTKMYLSSGMTLGIPYEFAIPLRPIPDVAVKKIYSFEKLENATNAGMQMARSGYARTVKLRSSGFQDMLVAGKISNLTRTENHLVVKMEGNQAIVDAGGSIVDGLATKTGGKVVEAQPDVMKVTDPSSVSSASWPIGICVCDTKGLASAINDIFGMATNANRAFQYSVSDISSTSSILIPLVQGPPSKELLSAIGSYLINSRMTLRGNPGWNPILGDARAITRAEIVNGIKKLLDPNMILNPHVMEVF